MSTKAYNLIKIITIIIIHLRQGKCDTSVGSFTNCELKFSLRQNLELFEDAQPL